MRTIVVLPVWVPPPEVRPAAELTVECSMLNADLRNRYPRTSSINWYWAVMLCGCEDNRRSGTGSTDHASQTQWYIHPWAQWPAKGR